MEFTIIQFNDNGMILTRKFEKQQLKVDLYQSLNTSSTLWGGGCNKCNID